MTTLINQRKMDALKSVGDCMYVLVIMMVIDHEHPGRTSTLRDLLPAVYPVIKDQRKLEQQLNSLCASNRLVRTGAGYVLVEGGKALFLDIFGNPFNAEFEIGRKDKDLALSPASAGPVIQAQALEIIESSDVEPARKFRALEEVEEESSLLNIKVKDSSTPTTESEKNAEITVRMILRHTPLVFSGNEVITKDIPIEAIDAHEALAVIAHCYSLRKSDDNPTGILNRPAGVAHSMLKDGRRARTEFRLDPTHYLPEAYLEALGLMEYACEVCQQTFKTKADLLSHDGMLLDCKYGCGRRFHGETERTAHYESDHLEEIEALRTPATFTRLADDHKAVKLWKLVKDALQMEMARASFDTWIRDVIAVGFENKELTLLARNSYGRDWLENRMQPNIEAKLKAFTHEDIHLVLVIGSVDDDDE